MRADIGIAERPTRPQTIFESRRAEAAQDGIVHIRSTLLLEGQLPRSTTWSLFRTADISTACGPLATVAKPAIAQIVPGIMGDNYHLERLYSIVIRDVIPA